MKIDIKDPPSGVYFVQIKVGSVSAIKKVVKIEWHGDREKRWNGDGEI